MPNTREKLIGRLPVDDAILILREELKQRTDGYATHLSYGGKGDPAEEVSLDALEIAIEALEKQKWIPVSERKPDLELVEAKANDADVYPCLATIKHRMAKGGRYVGKVYYDGELFTNGDCLDLTDDVTHWMPLPEAPKGE